MVNDEKKANEGARTPQNRSNPRDRQIAISESDKQNFDKSFTDNGTKISLGTEGEYLGNHYSAAVKIRTNNVKYDKENRNYRVDLSYSTVARFIAWLKKDENKAAFNELLTGVYKKSSKSNSSTK